MFKFVKSIKDDVVGVTTTKRQNKRGLLVTPQVLRDWVADVRGEVADDEKATSRATAFR